MTLFDRQSSGPLATLVIGLAAGLDLAMQEAVHRVGSMYFRLVFLAVATIALATIHRIAPTNNETRYSRIAGRWPFAAIVAIFIVMVFNFPSEAESWSRILQFAIACAPWLMLTFGLLAVVQFSDVYWVSLRRACVIGAVLSVGVQPLFVAIRAPVLSWAPRTTPSLTHDGLTVYLLLDELNAKAAGPIEAALKSGGLSTAWKAVRPVGDATANVIPAMFSGQLFNDVKPCSQTAVCSRDQVLDFAQIVVDRNDIDIVGFYHPYCDIQGLRWCHRAVIHTEVDRLERWLCPVFRRTGWRIGTDAQKCDDTYRHPWNAMVDDALEAIWQAPAWKKGGVLFVHVPLPHPPGRLPLTSLVENYQDSVRRSAKLVERMVRLSLQGSSRLVTFIVFSDHPLRQAMWCNDQWVFAAIGCQIQPEFVDVNVPLIVAGNGPLPQIEHVATNLDVFHLPFATFQSVPAPDKRNQ